MPPGVGTSCYRSTCLGLVVVPWFCERPSASPLGDHRALAHILQDSLLQWFLAFGLGAGWEKLMSRMSAGWASSCGHTDFFSCHLWPWLIKAEKLCLLPFNSAEDSLPDEDRLVADP